MRSLYFGIFLAFASVISRGRSLRILGVFTHNGRSHFMMHETIMKSLAERGHRVDVVSHFPPEKPFPNYNQVVNLDGTLPDLKNNVTYARIKQIAVDKSIVLTMAINHGVYYCDFMDVPRFKALIRNPPNDPPYDLLIVDVFSAHCYLALGQHFNVPMVGVVTSPMWPWTNHLVANPDNPAYIPSVLSDFAGQMNFWERLINTIGLIKQKWEFYYHGAEQNDKIRKYLGPHAPSLEEAEKNLSLILVNTHHSLNGVRPFTQAVVEVGGIHAFGNAPVLTNDLEEWLNDSKRGFVYISFGAMVKIESFPVETIRALYRSLEKLSPVRVLMKIARPEELPPGLPKNVITRTWVPQMGVLRHKNIRAFMTHGGLMGTQEAVYYGVPMIGVPLFADQFQIMKGYVTNRIAVMLRHDQLTEETLDAAFQTVLHDPSYMKAAKRLSSEFRDRPMSPVDTAVFWVEYVARHGGSNLRSPAMDLNWWQIALLDVFGALLFVVVLALYLSRLVIKKLIAVRSNKIERMVKSKKIK